MSPQNPQHILALTLYGEARGEYTRLDGGLAALIAVGNVVVNRVRARSWFGHDIISVCLKKQQFSCWNPSDPNRPLLEAVTKENLVFQVCFDVAEHLCTQTYPDLTQGSTHYHHYASHPSWARGLKPKARIGRHVFYRAA